MLRSRLTATGNGLNYGKLAFAVLIALAFCLVHPASTAYAKKKKKLSYGTIKIRTTPGGFPLAIDGKSEGETTSDYVDHTIDPGRHTIVVTMPGGQRWSRDINEIGRASCRERV